ncbi:MAG TPA: hypothetical protein VKC89_01360 [Patescibacteria group bacterium]|nr:hypothetical protein [Patescibacteria group bacterium]
MKLKTELMLLCDYAIIARDGKLSINGIFDEVRLQKLPGGLARAFFVATIQGQPRTSYKLELKFQYKDQNIMPPHNINTVETGSNGKNNIVVELMGVTFPKEGDYELKIYHGDDVIGTTTLKAIQVQEPKVFKMPN